MEGINNPIETEVLAELFETQRAVERQWKETGVCLEQMRSQAESWTGVFEETMEHYKTLGSVASWMEQTLRRLQAISCVVGNLSTR